MSKARSAMLSMSREAYRNPYAHIEELEQDYQEEEQKLHRQTPAVASAPSPEVFHNPYLFIDNEESEVDSVPKTRSEGVNEGLAATSYPIKPQRNKRTPTMIFRKS